MLSIIFFTYPSQRDFLFFQGYAMLEFVNQKICLILAHPDLSAYRVVLSWLRIIDHIWNKEIA